MSDTALERAAMLVAALKKNIGRFPKMRDVSLDAVNGQIVFETKAAGQLKLKIDEFLSLYAKKS